MWGMWAFAECSLRKMMHHVLYRITLYINIFFVFLYAYFRMLKSLLSWMLWQIICLTTKDYLSYLTVSFIVLPTEEYFSFSISLLFIMLRLLIIYFSLDSCLSIKSKTFHIFVLKVGNLGNIIFEKVCREACWFLKNSHTSPKTRSSAHHERRHVWLKDQTAHNECACV